MIKYCTDYLLSSACNLILRSERDNHFHDSKRAPLLVKMSSLDQSLSFPAAYEHIGVSFIGKFSWMVIPAVV